MDKQSTTHKKWLSFLKRSLPRHHHNQPKNDSSGTINSQPGSDLGPHAGEKRMPRWLVRVLERGDKIKATEIVQSDGVKTLVDLKVVETPGLIPALARLSETDSSIRCTFYCSPFVHRVARMRREGSFCAYRNIQTMLSYIINAKVAINQPFDQRPLPSIFLLQEMIEKAWEQGFNTSSRDDVGSLLMTRKFIGTSEVEAFFLSVGVPVSTRSFVSSTNSEAHQSLIEYVAQYFEINNTQDQREKVVVTSKPPVFLQRPGHSVTIVGLEENIGGSQSLMVFDPHDQPSKSIKKIALGEALPVKPEKLLQRYRYDTSELAKYNAFEIVSLGDQVAEAG